MTPTPDMYLVPTELYSTKEQENSSNDKRGRS
eukprot:CAMPEP_0197270884 /NCGR_PEP_ID=MMETSP1432-20130617/7757_1 /TAXON_ID=44447 /ORGANISM="Pseudo-nitzschia delicatissima, Strain UNC1205" /LENGTH=31 /DNA_ID= /DNA_START= /DNA_END= /DNA_ORIENTATION=